MIDIEKRIKEFADTVIKIKNSDISDLPAPTRKLIQTTELRYVVYVKMNNKGECKGIYFLPYSHKKFKNIISKFEKTMNVYMNLEITPEMLEVGYYDKKM